jgi:outer membrane protein OmpA-like peptidoglycan-associated protein
MYTKRILCLLTVASASLLGLPAAAQLYPGEDVVVNPAAIPPVPSAGQSYTIHKPVHHRRRPAAPKPVVTDTQAASAASPDTANVSIEQTPTAAPPPPPPAKSKRERHTGPAAQAATAAPDTQQQGNGMGFTFGEDSSPAAAPPANAKTASAEPAPAETPKPGKPDMSEAGLAKRGAILFEHNSTDPQPSQLDGIKLLAGDLNSALDAGATQIQLQAFGGSPGDKSSEARRISLRRALAIRQLLIDNGVPSNKIITKAMGGITDKGEPDRVDIYVRAS